MGQRIEPDEPGAARRRRAAAHGVEQPFRHAPSERPRGIGGQWRAQVELEAELGAETAAGLLDAHDPTGLIEAHKPGAHVDRGEIDHLAVGADRNLRSAAADIDVHHRRFVADRARHRA